MEIRNILRGETTSFAASARPAERTEPDETAAAQPSADRVELSCQWLEQMEEQRAQILSLLRDGQDPEEQSNSLLDGALQDAETKQKELDALSEALDVQMKCLKIAMNIMKGKKVPPEDERYLMENDPNGYKVAIAMKALVKEDKKECKSVLDDEDKEGGETAETEESAPAESSGGEAAASSGGEAE